MICDLCVIIAYERCKFHLSIKSVQSIVLRKISFKSNFEIDCNAKCPSLVSIGWKPLESRACHWVLCFLDQISQPIKWQQTFSREDFANHVPKKKLSSSVMWPRRLLPTSLPLLVLACVRVVREMVLGAKGSANVVENILFWCTKTWEKAQWWRPVSFSSDWLRSLVWRSL